MIFYNDIRQNDHGNVLFLILIAVALFAALSYAITQSNPTEGASAGREANLVAGAAVIQYSADIATAITRMILGGVSADDLDMVSPGEASFNTPPFTAKVFHPNGGGVVYQYANSNALERDTIVI
jgi:hypothetical protein